MGYFDLCEACGQSESLVVDGLCHRCARLEQRAAYGTSTLPRITGAIYENGRIARIQLEPMGYSRDAPNSLPHDHRAVTRLATNRRETDDG